jgi:rare lipoprotein A
MSEPRQFVLMLSAVVAATVMGAVEQTAASFFPRTDSSVEESVDRLLMNEGLFAAIAGAEATVGRVPDPPERFEEIGQASWYGSWHHGRKTASGATFDMNEMTAAHRTLPLGTQVRVTNLDNGYSVEVRINDRGPYVGTRVIDLSREAARRLRMEHEGIAPVRIEELIAAPGRTALN